MMSDKKENNKLIPRLRFPEFKDNGEWEEKQLYYCLDYLQPTPYLVQSSYYDDKYEIPVLTAGKSFILGYTNEKEGVFKNNLPVIIFDDFTTDSKFVDFPFKVKSSALKILLPKNGNNIKFVYESMQNLKYEVGVHKRHWISVFSKLKIALPVPKEQQKIAAFLSNLDELIEAHRQKLELLKRHKKGLMQNLFPQEGEKVPKFRFPEFRDSGEWEEKRLGEITEVLTKRNKENKNLPVYSINNKNGFVPQSEQFEGISSNKRGYDISLYKVIEKHTFAYNPARINVGSIGYSGELSNVIISSLYVCFKTNEEVVDEFLLHFFNTFNFRKEVKNRVEGGIRNYLFYQNFSRIHISIPSIQEQQKIAACLSSLDEVIAAQEEKIAQLEKHKKGLMQGVFP